MTLLLRDWRSSASSDDKLSSELEDPIDRLLGDSWVSISTKQFDASHFRIQNNYGQELEYIELQPAIFIEYLEIYLHDNKLI